MSRDEPVGSNTEERTRDARLGVWALLGVVSFALYRGIQESRRLAVRRGISFGESGGAAIEFRAMV